MRTVRWMLLCAALVAGVGACGRKNDLEQPPESKAEASYPRTYPAR